MERILKILSETYFNRELIVLDESSLEGINANKIKFTTFRKLIERYNKNIGTIICGQKQKKVS